MTRYLEVNEHYFAPDVVRDGSRPVLRGDPGRRQPRRDSAVSQLVVLRRLAGFLRTAARGLFTADRMEPIAEEAVRFGRWPDILVAYFWMPDHQGHEFGKGSKEYHDILPNLDRQVGRICDDLREAGMFDRSLLVLTTDHGCVPTDPARRVAMREVLENRFGMKTAYEPTPPKLEYPKRYELLAADRVAMTDDGDRRAALHLRVGDEWRVPPTLEQIERFHRDYGSPAVQIKPGPFWRVLLEEIAPAGQLAAVRAGSNQVLLERRGRHGA